MELVQINTFGGPEVLKLKSLLTLETNYPKEKMESILHYSGLPMPCRCIIDAIEQVGAKGVAA